MVLDPAPLMVSSATPFDLTQAKSPALPIPEWAVGEKRMNSYETCVSFPEPTSVTRQMKLPLPHAQFTSMGVNSAGDRLNHLMRPGCLMSGSLLRSKPMAEITWLISIPHLPTPALSSPRFIYPIGFYLTLF